MEHNKRNLNFTIALVLLSFYLCIVQRSIMLKNLCSKILQYFTNGTRLKMYDAFTFHVISILFASMPFLCSLSLLFSSFIILLFLTLSHTLSLSFPLSLYQSFSLSSLTGVRQAMTYIQLNGSELAIIKVRIFRFCWSCCECGLASMTHFYESHQAHKRFTNIFALTSRRLMSFARTNTILAEKIPISTFGLCLLSARGQTICNVFY